MIAAVILAKSSLAENGMVERRARRSHSRSSCVAVFGRSGKREFFGFILIQTTIGTVVGEGKGSLFNTTQTKGVMFDPDSGLDTVLEKCFGYPGYFAVESADVDCCGLLEEFQQSPD